MVGKLRHIKQVAGDARHDLAHLGLAVIGEGQLRQVGKQALAHIALNLGAHDVPLGLHIIAAARLQKQQAHIQRAQLQHHIQRDAAGV